MLSDAALLKPLRRMSGNLTADRRADYAEMLFGSGEHRAAAEVMLGAVELAPDWALGWFRLGEMQEAAGALGEAVVAWRMALTIDPDDRTGSALKLQLAGAAPRRDAPPSAFVEALFDQYADDFDHALVETLGYCVPALLTQAIEAAGVTRFDRVVDLGCGTGLMGERLRPIVDDLEGHDISVAMLAKARSKGVYDRLVRSDLQTLELRPASIDLAVCADVFLYVGALERIFAMVATALRPGGLFGFSVESSTTGEPLVLQSSRRYAHSERYIRKTLAASGFAVVSLDQAFIRQDRGAPIEGLIVVASCEK
jgi:predicted TPR repeat methyltransferase